MLLGPMTSYNFATGLERLKLKEISEFINVLEACKQYYFEGEERPAVSVRPNDKNPDGHYDWYYEFETTIITAETVTALEKAGFKLNLIRRQVKTAYC